jgi:hypothetical protein
MNALDAAEDQILSETADHKIVCGFFTSLLPDNGEGVE